MEPQYFNAVDLYAPSVTVTGTQNEGVRPEKSTMFQSTMDVGESELQAIIATVFSEFPDLIPLETIHSGWNNSFANVGAFLEPLAQLIGYCDSMHILETNPGETLVLHFLKIF